MNFICFANNRERFQKCKNVFKYTDAIFNHGFIGDEDGIILENVEMRLILRRDGKALSLVHKSTGQECLQPGIKIPAFSITQNRPNDNELQIKYPANPKTFCADSVYMKGDDLDVSFELINIVALPSESFKKINFQKCIVNIIN